MTRWLRNSLSRFERSQIVKRKKTDLLFGMLMKQKLVEKSRFEGQKVKLIFSKILSIISTYCFVNNFMTSIELNFLVFSLIECN